MKTNRQLEILECFYGDGMVQRKKSCPKIEECRWYGAEEEELP